MHLFISGAKHSDHIKFTNLLSQSDFSDSDLSLLSWLQSIPSDTFSCPFEQRSLNVDVERLKNPLLETSWTEHMLITPIKPNIFPHSAMPNTRPKGADIMTKSLNVSAMVSSEGKQAMKPENGSNTASHTNAPAMVDMSKSLASFHLSSSGQPAAKSRPMDESVDHLFKEGESIAPIEGKVVLTMCIRRIIHLLTFSCRKPQRSTRTTRQNKTITRLPSTENHYRRTQVRRGST